MASRPVQGRAWLWAPPLAYMLLIFYLSSQSDPMPVLTENVWDKAVHTIEYAVLGFLFCRAFVGEDWPLTLGGSAALAATSLYGASDEWHQLFTPGRSSDIHDWFADTLGALLGVILFAAIVSTVSRLRRQPRR
jgi:VanZ family protein